MATKVKTYVLTNVVGGTGVSITGLLTTDGLSLGDYGGFLYQICSAGDSNTYPFASGSHGPGSGFMNSGYIDLVHPYPVSDILVQNYGLNMSLAVYFPPGGGDPTNGAYPIVIRAPQGTTYENTNIVDINNNPFPSDYVRTGFYNGGVIQNSGVLQTQRGVSFTAPYSSSGNGSLISSVYGAGLDGGGGFYGTDNNSLNGFGYFSGTKGNTNPLNYGYVVISFIPTGAFTRSPFLSTSSQNYQTASNENFILYSLMGGGGGGASSENPGVGAGGGGAGDWNMGILFTNVNQTIGVTGGAGGAGGAAATFNPGQNGQSSSVSYNTSIISSIGGKGGPYPGVDDSFDGNGGAGYYGGGGGSTNKDNSYRSFGGDSYAIIPSYYGGTGDRVIKTGGFGAGSVTYNLSGVYFGVSFPAPGSPDPHSTGGGGGGFWGGNGALDGSNISPDSNPYNVIADGYGSGGGGGSFQSNAAGENIGGGNGSNGFALLKYFNNTNTEFKFYKVTQTQIFDIVDYRNAVGFWCFLGGDSGKSYHNTFHFLIKEDGVKHIKCIKGSSGFSINVYFDSYNNQPQIFNTNATTNESYMMLMFYY
jgi:hypothetical protein